MKASSEVWFLIPQCMSYMGFWPNAMSLSFVNSSCFLLTILLILTFLADDSLTTDGSELKESLDAEPGMNPKRIARETKGKGILL